MIASMMSSPMNQSGTHLLRGRKYREVNASTRCSLSISCHRSLTAWRTRSMILGPRSRSALSAVSRSMFLWSWFSSDISFERPSTRKDDVPDALHAFAAEVRSLSQPDLVALANDGPVAAERQRSCTQRNLQDLLAPRMKAWRWLALGIALAWIVL